MLDTNRGIRWFAEQFIYNNPKHADYFVTSVLLLINSAITLGTVFRWQFVHGSLPMWLIYAYYFSWVGIGGRIMGAAYALAHKEVIEMTAQTAMIHLDILCLTFDMYNNPPLLLIHHHH